MIDNKPFVAVIDDRPDAGASEICRLLNEDGDVTAEAFLPGDITEDLLVDASTVLVDYRIEDWPGRSHVQEIGLKPRNGLALASVLRQYCRSDQPTAIALLSDGLEDLYHDLSPKNRRHVLARVESLEWVFGKSDPERCAQINSLAHGMTRIRELVREGNLTPQAALLNAESHLWNEELESSIDRCLPPLNELAQLTHGAAFARWFLQRVLPYPAFLVDINHVAARLQVTPGSLLHALNSNSSINEELGKFEYRGVFADFLGKRWWRSSLEDWLWAITEGRSFNSDAIFRGISNVAGIDLAAANVGPDPVVTVGPDYESTQRLAPREECVAVFPDDWPAYADKAYVTLAEAEADQRLKVLVMRDEMWRLKEGLK